MAVKTSKNSYTDRNFCSLYDIKLLLECYRRMLVDSSLITKHSLYHWLIFSIAIRKTVITSSENLIGEVLMLLIITLGIQSIACYWRFV